MKRIILKIGKCLIVYIVVFMTMLTGVSYGLSQDYLGSAIASSAAYIASTYTSNVNYSQGLRSNNPIWSPNSYSWSDGTYYFDCSSFASGVYHYVTNGALFPIVSSTSSLVSLSGSDYERGLVEGESSLEIGDIVVWNNGTKGHATIYVGSEIGGSGQELAEVGGASGNIGFRSISYLSSHTFYYVRASETAAESLTEADLNLEFSSATVSSGGSSYNFSNFYFNGIPDGTYSIASNSFWSSLIETLASIADYLIGILTYIIRMVIVGWTSIIDRLFNWSINTITTVTIEIDEDGSKVEDSDDDTSVEDMGISGADVDETDSEEKITLESLFYGDYDLVDINIFDTSDTEDTEATTDSE